VFSTDLRIRRCGDHAVVTLCGELDLVDAALVATALMAAADREPWLVVDLASLEFIDVSGVSALARARKHARQAGGDLLLAAPPPQMMRVLAATALAYGFSVYASVAAAVSGFRGSLPVAVSAQGPVGAQSGELGVEAGDTG